MKLTLLLVFACLVNISYGQQDTLLKQPSARAQSVYGELGGNGILFSANYDVRFTRSQKGLGARIGLGYLFDVLTVPVAINYLAGRSPNLFEAGLGVTYATVTNSDEFFYGHGTAVVISIGYRYQPVTNGFTARVFLSPLIDVETGDAFFYGGVSFGFKF